MEEKIETMVYGVTAVRNGKDFRYEESVCRVLYKDKEEAQKAVDFTNKFFEIGGVPSKAYLVEFLLA